MPTRVLLSCAVTRVRLSLPSAASIRPRTQTKPCSTPAADKCLLWPKNLHPCHTVVPTAMIYSINLTTCDVIWEVLIPALGDPGVEEVFFALGMPPDGSALYAKADGVPNLSLVIDPSTGNITSEQREADSKNWPRSLAYDAVGHQWFGLNMSCKDHQDSAFNLFSFPEGHSEKVTAFQTFPIPPSWFPKFDHGAGLDPNMVALEDGKHIVIFGVIQDVFPTGEVSYFNPVVTMDTHTGKLLAAVEVKFPDNRWRMPWVLSILQRRAALEEALMHAWRCVHPIRPLHIKHVLRPATCVAREDVFHSSLHDCCGSCRRWSLGSCDATKIKSMDSTLWHSAL